MSRTSERLAAAIAEELQLRYEGVIDWSHLGFDEIVMFTDPLTFSSFPVYVNELNTETVRAIVAESRRKDWPMVQWLRRQGFTDDEIADARVHVTITVVRRHKDEEQTKEPQA